MSVLTRLFGHWPALTRESLRADVLAGLTGAIVVLPQGVAYAMLAGMPAAYGLYSAMIPCALAALMGSSLKMVTGPANAISLTVLALITPLAAPESPRYVQLVITLTFMVGVWQLVVVLSRAGRWVDKVSHTVIVGFSAGAALLIINAQVGNFFGLKIPRGLSIIQTLMQFLESIPKIAWDVTSVAVFTLLAARLAKPLNKTVPSILVALIVGSVFAAILHWFGWSSGVPTVQALPSALPPVSMPDFSWDTLRSLLVASWVMTLLALAEALSIAKALALKERRALNSDREIAGQGLANLAGAFFSSYPASGSFNRSGVNVSAGAVTPLAAVFASGFLVVILLLVAPWAKFLPYAVIAALLVIVAKNLVDLREIKHLLRDRVEAIVLLGTFLATVSLSLEWAILLGIALSVLAPRLLKK